MYKNGTFGSRFFLADDERLTLALHFYYSKKNVLVEGELFIIIVRQKRNLNFASFMLTEYLQDDAVTWH